MRLTLKCQTNNSIKDKKKKKWNKRGEKILKVLVTNLLTILVIIELKSDLMKIFAQICFMLIVVMKNHQNLLVLKHLSNIIRMFLLLFCFYSS